MIKIANQGNLSGSKPEKENSPEYIQAALSAGFAVKIDIWLINGRICLGEDTPQYEVDFSFVNNSRIFAQCRNFDALNFMIERGMVDCDFFYYCGFRTLTRDGFIWGGPEEEIGRNSIIIDLENKVGYKGVVGICSDYWV